MKINRITLTNFRQYYGKNIVDLPVESKRNIIVIGGKNGYGKTNLLVSLVWCLYGEDIFRVDENFKREIRKEGNYSKFLKGCLNWKAARESINTFSVEIEISEVELPEANIIEKSNNHTCKITRKFDAASSDDSFDISIEGIKKPFFRSAEEKSDFINDYLIPIEAAKFVFFDAEKIASWAELSTKEEGSVLNDAVGKILGLDIYESLITDLRIYTDGQKKESATTEVRQQINASENGIRINIEKLEEVENDILNKSSQVAELKNEIAKCETVLAKSGYISVNSQNLDKLYVRRTDLKAKEKQLENKFHELCEILPFAIAAGKLEEAINHINKQEQSSFSKEEKDQLTEKNDEIIEKLFNTPPFPTNGDISFLNKTFYAEKAKKIIEEIFSTGDDNSELEFSHDLAKYEVDLIRGTFTHIRTLSKDVFEQTIENFDQVRNNILENERLIKKIEGEQEDEEVIEYTNRKNEAERKIERLSEEKGGLIAQKSIIIKTSESLHQRLQVDLRRVTVSEQKKKNFDKATRYIDTLLEFIEQQKKDKCIILEEAIYTEMKKLMHKLNDGLNGDFISDVKVDILPGNDGLKVLLYDSDGNIRQKETLSQGEKQIYISSLIKAILSLSIREFPIFIDTPLGKLDDDHIKKVLLYYYPDLASQVVLMATSNEIPSSRLDLVKGVVSQTYLLECTNNQTKFKQGYFKNYEN